MLRVTLQWVNQQATFLLNFCFKSCFTSCQWRTVTQKYNPNKLSPAMMALSENGPCCLIYLNVWAPVCEPLWESLGVMVAMMKWVWPCWKRHATVGGLWGLKTPGKAQSLSPCLQLMDQMLSYCSSNMPAYLCTHTHSEIMDSPSEIVNMPPNKCFLL